MAFASNEAYVAHFRNVLSNDFVTRYLRRQTEYRTMPSNRMYCKHQLLASTEPKKGASTLHQLALVGRHLSAVQKKGIELVECGAIIANRTETKSRMMVCYRCEGLVCGDCEAPLHTRLRNHTCRQPMQAETEEDRFSGMVRGRDYQLCLNVLCQNSYELSDGCNHIICPILACKTSFCFICGEEADHDSNHWAASKPCPQYNQPGSANAQHDADEAETQPFLFDLVHDLDEHNAQPLLEAPPEGQAWATVPAQVRRNAARYVVNTMDEFRANFDLFEDERMAQIARLITRLNMSLKFQFTLSRVLRDLPQHHDQIPVEDRGTFTDFTA